MLEVSSPADLVSTGATVRADSLHTRLGLGCNPRILTDRSVLNAKTMRSPDSLPPFRQPVRSRLRTQTRQHWWHQHSKSPQTRVVRSTRYVKKLRHRGSFRPI